ncbi:hypothetical protein ACZ11_03975 [Lysinibacillus xylanilyticus]|uniref:Uncharacterized protein n=1 Tax=Lysinibacillus xylanilyticus TaxID=582475 RepID=A0A0K9FB13_9BACI|nr:hypothetical protein ACZ11_03975 [Lysinibacillus xylanilyticus]
MGDLKAVELPIIYSLTDFFNMKKSNITFKNDCSDRIVSSGRVKKDCKKIRNFLKFIIAEKRPYSIK